MRAARGAILLLALWLLLAAGLLSCAAAQDSRGPQAAFTISPQKPEPGRNVTASALPVSKAFPPCDPLATYEWDWDGDGTFEENRTGASGGFVSAHTFPDEGVYAVALRVTDRCGAQAVAVVNLTVGDPLIAKRFDWDIVFGNQRAFVRAAWLVLWVSVVTILVGLPLGVIVGLARLSRIAPVRWVATAYVEFLRGTPLLVQIFIVWLALPEISPKLKFTPLVSGIIALVINTSAYQGEIIRAGIQAIPSGQQEAALGLGLSRWQAMRFVVLPQAMRLVIPPLTNEFIILVKDTSLLSVIGVIELMGLARILGSRHFSVFEPFLAVAVIYFVMTFALSQVARVLEKRLAIPGLGVATGGGH